MAHVQISRHRGGQVETVATEVDSPFVVSVHRAPDISDPFNQLTVACFGIGAFAARAVVPYEDGEDTIGPVVAALLAVVLDHAAEIRDAMKEAKP